MIKTSTSNYMSKSLFKFLIILITLLIIIILLLIFFIFSSLNTLNSEIQVHNNKPQSFEFLSKRIFVEEPNEQFVNFIPLRDAMNNYLKDYKSNFAVYFEYLPTGISIGVNEKEDIPIASIAKIPTVMKIYSLIKEGKITETDTIILSEQMLDNAFGDLWKKGMGFEISIKELINKTLIESDNTAHNALLSKLDNRYDIAVYNTLDIRLTKDENGNNYPLGSVKSITSIFKNLYFANYLNPKDSNSILEKLTKSKFNSQIVAGTKDVPVAHKIGVLQSNSKELFHNDCGIIYIPKRNYILCMLYKGTQEDADKQMAYVSKMIFQYLSQITEHTKK